MHFDPATTCVEIGHLLSLGEDLYILILECKHASCLGEEVIGARRLVEHNLLRAALEDE